MRVLEINKAYEIAIKFCRRGIEVDCTAEEFYQGLIRGYLAMGQFAQAVATYQQLEVTLAVVLRTSPSPVTKTLRDSVPNVLTEPTTKQ